MAEHRKPVHLVLNDNLAGRLAVIHAATTEWLRREKIAAATWEPHDWSEEW